jgi:hypothetical protein
VQTCGTRASGAVDGVYWRVETWKTRRSMRGCAHRGTRPPSPARFRGRVLRAAKSTRVTRGRGRGGGVTIPRPRISVHGQISYHSGGRVCGRGRTSKPAARARAARSQRRPPACAPEILTAPRVLPLVPGLAWLPLNRPGRSESTRGSARSRQRRERAVERARARAQGVAVRAVPHRSVRARAKSGNASHAASAPAVGSSRKEVVVARGG